jgi:hypothetical protein
MSAAVEHATVSPSVKAVEVEAESSVQPPATRECEGLSCALPGLGEDAIVRVDRARPRRDPAEGDALVLTVEGETWWTRAFGAGERIVRLGTLPDLDGDHVAEVRAAYLSPRGTGVFTRIMAGRTGQSLYDVGPEYRSLVWDKLEGGDATARWLEQFGVPLVHSPPTTRRSELLRSIALTADSRNLQGARPRPSRVNGAPAARTVPDPSPVLGPTQPTVTLRRVVFSNSHQVIRDRAPQIAYPPEWLDANLDGDANDWVQSVTTPFAGDIRAPLCYTINQPITVSSVEFHVSPAYGLGANLNGKVAKGRLPGGYEAFSSTMLAYNGNGTIIAATNVTGAAGTMTTIARIADYSIDWRIDVTGSLTSYPAGTSRNHVHWVLLPPTGSFTLFYALIDIGCRQAHGLDGSSHVAIADAVFGEFSPDRIVYRATDVLEGFPPIGLAYVTDWFTTGLTAGDLLLVGDAQCAAWTQFFEWCLFAVGIDPFNENIEVFSDQYQNILGASAELVVPLWAFNGQHTPPPFQTYPHLNIWNFPRVIIYGSRGEGSYQWRFADAIDQTGAPSQGITLNPRSLFITHYVTVVESRIYDSSFGNVYASFDAFESGAMQGYALDFTTNNLMNGFQVNEQAVGVDLNNDGEITDVWVIVPGLTFRTNPAGDNLERIYRDRVR